MTARYCETAGHTWQLGAHWDVCIMCGAEREHVAPEIFHVAPDVELVPPPVVELDKSATACEYCGKSDKPVDLDIAHVPPVLCCRRCKRLPSCTRCNVRRGRVDLDGVCCRCNAQARAAAKRASTVRCSAAKCRAKIDITETNEHGECKGCTLDRMYRDFPITRSNP